MTQWATGHNNSSTQFSDAQWRLFRALQARYLNGLHFFSNRETARLEFLRWLRQNASLGEAGFEYPATSGHDSSEATYTDAKPRTGAPRDRPKRQRFRPEGERGATHSAQLPQTSTVNQSGQGVEHAGEQQ